MQGLRTSIGTLTDINWKRIKVITRKVSPPTTQAHFIYILAIALRILFSFQGSPIYFKVAGIF